MQTTSKNLELRVELDERIDESVVSSGSRDDEKDRDGDVDGRGCLWVYGDDLRLHQILGNLCSNAVKVCLFFIYILLLFEEMID